MFGESSVQCLLSVIVFKWNEEDNGEGEEGEWDCRGMGECMHMTVPARLAGRTEPPVPTGLKA